METEQQPEEQAHKKGRHRKKQLYKTILQQMEFYFSDSNLSKDRFLSQLIQSDPYIDISIFLKFNKLQKLTTNVNDIVKAITKSELLELSEDKTKVHRKLPIKIKENVEDCTIYVERLKSDATHDWLTTIFSKFGKVVYVSIPKYKQNGRIKGFAFVEFENDDGANEALKYFESIDCKIPSFMEPQKLCSIITFEGDNTGEETNDRSAKKRKSIEELEYEGKKRTKLDDDDDDTVKKKTKKLHKKKDNLKEIGLQILSKKEWKKMRNRYLDMQKNVMKKLKKHLGQQRRADRFEREKKENVEVKKPNDFQPGIIVKVNLMEPCADNKKLKDEIKMIATNVKYVDVPSPIGGEEVYVRFADPKDAESFCLSTSKGKSVILNGDEEKRYWEKIEMQRSTKLKKSTIKQRGRDKLLKKAEQQIAKHIHFDDCGNDKS